MFEMDKGHRQAVPWGGKWGAARLQGGPSPGAGDSGVCTAVHVPQSAGLSQVTGTRNRAETAPTFVRHLFQDQIRVITEHHPLASLPGKLLKFRLWCSLTDSDSTLGVTRGAPIPCLQGRELQRRAVGLHAAPSVSRRTELLIKFIIPV